MDRQREIYFEFFVLANQVKVSAIDGATGVEVSIVAPQGASEDEMKRVALAKLQRRLDQEFGSEEDTATQVSKNSGRGILV